MQMLKYPVERVMFYEPLSFFFNVWKRIGIWEGYVGGESCQSDGYRDRYSGQSKIYEKVSHSGKTVPFVKGSIL